MCGHLLCQARCCIHVVLLAGMIFWLLYCHLPALVLSGHHPCTCNLMMHDDIDCSRLKCLNQNSRFIFLLEFMHSVVHVQYIKIYLHSICIIRQGTKTSKCVGCNSWVHLVNTACARFQCCHAFRLDPHKAPDLPYWYLQPTSE